MTTTSHNRFKSTALKVFIAWGILPVLLVALIATFAVIEPRFASIDNIVNISRQASFMIVITLGQMLYLVTRNYDLSNGANVALTTIVTAIVMTRVDFGGNTTLAIVVACSAGLVVGVMIGAINGYLVAYAKINSFMVTLGTASVTTGIALLVSGGVPITGLPKQFTSNFGAGRILGVPIMLIVAILVIGVLYYFLVWTKSGRHIFAVGGNPDAAYQAGVNVKSTVFIVMILGSLLASLVGIMTTARVGTGEANIGLEYPLMSIVAGVLGGISLQGGEGRIAGAVMGAIFIVILSNGMDLIRVQSYVQNIVLGTLLIVALLVDRIRLRTRQSR